jgi:hypothetical protein
LACARQQRALLTLDSGIKTQAVLAGVTVMELTE